MTPSILYLYHGNDTFTSTTFSGFVSFANNVGWSVQRIDLHFDLTRGHLSKLLSFWRPAGLVYDAGNCDKPFAWVADLLVPFVAIDADQTACREPTDILGFVNCDADEIAKCAAQTFLQRGIRNFAFIPEDISYSWCKARQRAFASVLELNGYSLATFSGEKPYPDKPRTLRCLGRWLKQLSSPCGVLAANDKIGSFVLAAAEQRGLSVPEDLSVIGTDDDETICEMTHPTLTSIRLDFAKGGYLAGRLLQDIMSNRHSDDAAHLYGVQRFCERLSTRTLKKSSPTVRNALEVIHRRAAEGISTADILPLLGGSRRAAEKRFRAATDKSILQEILDAKFSRLLRLLDNDDLPLGALSGLAGFPSENHLRRQFKARFGLSMSEFKKRRRQS